MPYESVRFSLNMDDLNSEVEVAPPKFNNNELEDSYRLETVSDHEKLYKNSQSIKLINNSRSFSTMNTINRNLSFMRDEPYTLT